MNNEYQHKPSSTYLGLCPHRPKGGFAILSIYLGLCPHRLKGGFAILVCEDTGQGVVLVCEDTDQGIGVGE